MSLCWLLLTEPRAVGQPYQPGDRQGPQTQAVEDLPDATRRHLEDLTRTFIDESLA